MHRRRFLTRLAALGACVVFPFRVLAHPNHAPNTKPRFGTNPFTLGIASGDPTPTGVVLWTRLAPDPLNGGGMSPEPVEVTWQMASDASMRKILRRGSAIARPELAHSVHVEVEGLEPDRWYWYRFVAGHEESPIGRTRTLPIPGAPVARLRFASVSCQHWEEGYFSAYTHLLREDLDFVIHLGDCIYGVSRGAFRRHERTDVPATLEQYRARHALYKTDPSLQAAHAALPFLVVLDNHDATPDNVEAGDFLARRAAVYQAWYEHMPVRGFVRSESAAMPVYRSFDIGRLARFTVLDTRQFRDDQDVCQELVDPDFGLGIYRPFCPTVLQDDRTMLGQEQEHWLAGRLQSSLASWNVIGTTVLFSPFTFFRNHAKYVYQSAWDYYPASRARLLALMAAGQCSNPIILSGDVHSSWALEVKTTPEDADSRTVATEFVCSSISASWPPPLNEPIEANLPANPHVKLYNGRLRGYCVCTVTPAWWRTEFRVIDTPQTLEPSLATLATFVVLDGQAGLVAR